MSISVAALRPSLADQSDLVWFHVDSFRALGRTSNFESVRRRILGAEPCGGLSEAAALGEDARVDAARRWQKIAEVLFRLSSEDQAVLRAYYGDELSPPVVRALAPFGGRQRAGVAILTAGARRAVALYELAARSSYDEARLERESDPAPRPVPWCPGEGPILGTRPEPSPSQVLDALIALARAAESKGAARENALHELLEIVREAEVLIARASNAYRHGERMCREGLEAVADRKTKEREQHRAGRRSRMREQHRTGRCSRMSCAA